MLDYSDEQIEGLYDELCARDEEIAQLRAKPIARATAELAEATIGQ